MLSSWVVLITMLICMTVFWESDKATFTIPVIGFVIFHLVRGDIPKMEHLRIHEMSKPLQIYAFIHYFSFAIFGLYIAIYKPELMTYDAKEFILFFFAIMFPLSISVIQTESELYKSYGNKNA